jgi:hypothetical protein
MPALTHRLVPRASALALSLAVLIAVGAPKPQAQEQQPGGTETAKPVVPATPEGGTVPVAPAPAGSPTGTIKVEAPKPGIPASDKADSALVRDVPPPESTVMAPDAPASGKGKRHRRGRAVGEDGLPLPPPPPPAMAVTVQNRSKPTLCAEDDNIYLTFSSAKLRHFRLDARPPAVIGSIVVDSTAPDFTDCTIADKPPGPEDKVERIVLFEDETMQLVGYRHAEFWRKGDVPLKVGDREEHQLHLVQLFTKTPKGPYEYLVMYPLDGYWRARPLPPDRLDQVAYGTSFLVGMVEEHERPVVSIQSIKFVPAVKSFELTYPKGDVATLRVTDLSQKAASVEVVFEQPVGGGRPFAALRSMYVTDTNADASEVSWKEPRGKGWGQRSVMDFRRAYASEIRLGRAIT